PTPRVSVLMCFLNGTEFLAEALASVRAQTWTDWELLLVDDGSTDNSVAVAQQATAAYADRVQILTHPGHANCGLSASRNLALCHARGEYVALLDADDVWRPEALARMVALLETVPEAAFVGGNALRWYSWTHNPTDDSLDYAPTISRFGLASPALLPPPQLLHLLVQDPTASPPTCSVLLRRVWLTAVEGFVDSFRTLYEDQALYAKLALRAPILLTDEIWANYRRHNNSVCAQMYGTEAEAGSRRTFLSWLEAYRAEESQPKGNKVLPD
ncbi:MAG: glycosyltransferase family 2 protein, partial [Hymenobacter sp.]